MDRIRDAMQIINRADFLPLSQRRYAAMDIPLPIGHRQTNSQPSTVRRMLEWLDPQPGDSVLDIGSGSGWTTALLAVLVGDMGHVYAVERIPELVEMGYENCAKYEFNHVEFYHAADVFGLPEYAPYERILVSASAARLPLELLDQLAIGGRMVISVGDDILEIHKLENGEFETIPHHGYVFVPLLAGPS